MKDRPMLTILIATALSASALPAAAQDNSQSAQPTQQQRTRDGGREARICINERVSESRLTRRICRTAQEWRDANDTADR